MKEIIDKLKSMDKAELDAVMQKAKNFAQTPQGQEFVQKLKDGKGTPQQEKAMKELGKDPNIAKLIFDILNGKG